MPPMTLGSVEDSAEPTTEPPLELWGAMDGRKRHPKPSALMSNSTKDGYTSVPILQKKTFSQPAKCLGTGVHLACCKVSAVA